MNYKNFNQTEQEPLYELHKTDYNNYSDLSHFVDEYRKAQELINECNRFYRSFLRSKLLTYKQLTNTVYKRERNKFYKISLYNAGTNGAPINYNKYLPDVAKHFGFDIGNDYNGYYSPYDGSAVMRICEFLASLKVAKECHNEPNYPLEVVIHKCAHDGRVVLAEFMYKKCPNVTYDYYGNSSWKKPTKNDLRTLGYESNAECDKKTKEFTDEILERWNKYQHDYIPDVIDYIGQENIVGIKISYDIVEQASKYAQDRETINKINKLLKGKTSMPINIFNYCSVETVYESYGKALSDTPGCWSHYPVPDAITAELKQNMDKIEIDIYPEIEELIHYCQQVIDSSVREEKNPKLYIMDENNTAQYFCNESDLHNVSINIVENYLVCNIEFDNSTYSRITRTSTHNVTNKRITFSIETNELVQFRTSTDKYEETIRYR